MQILAGACLRDQDDLTGVHAEMLDDVIDGFEDGDLITLNLAACRKVVGFDLTEHLSRRLQYRPKPVQQLRFWQHPAFVEFLLAAPLERTLADAADDPLGDVAAQVQNEIANAVRSLVRSPPEISIGEPLQAPFDFQQVFSEQRPRSIQK